MNKFRFIVYLTLVFIGVSGCKNEEAPTIDMGVVINELMAANSSVAADQNGEYDDWIELYNLKAVNLDISGYYLTDSKSKLTKWKFPAGTTISAKSYLVIWADSDTIQTGLHTNYKLSSSGETVIFLTDELKEIDRISFGISPDSTIQQSYARIPNGTGEFSWQLAPTYNSENIQNQ